MIIGRRKSLIFYNLLHFGFHETGPVPADSKGKPLPECDLPKCFLPGMRKGWADTGEFPGKVSESGGVIKISL